MTVFESVDYQVLVPESTFHTRSDKEYSLNLSCFSLSGEQSSSKKISLAILQWDYDGIKPLFMPFNSVHPSGAIEVNGHQTIKFRDTGLNFYSSKITGVLHFAVIVLTDYCGFKSMFSALSKMNAKIMGSSLAIELAGNLKNTSLLGSKRLEEKSDYLFQEISKLLDSEGIPSEILSGHYRPGEKTRLYLEKNGIKIGILTSAKQSDFN